MPTQSEGQERGDQWQVIGVIQDEQTAAVGLQPRHSPPNGDGLLLRLPFWQVE